LINEQFEHLIEKILLELPEKFREKMYNIGIVIDYESTSHKYKKNASTGELTLGLYEGVPYTKKPGSYSIFPDKITIYKKSLEAVSQNDEEMKLNVKKVILHEIGHYFGLEEDKLRNLGY